MKLEVVYMWADGLYVKAGIEDHKAALLVIIAATTEGKKVLLACESGERESKEGWSGILRDLIARGLRLPKLTVADGHLGIWSALGELHPEGREQRCWNHKSCNVLDKLPKKEQPAAKQLLRSMPYADTQKECEKQTAWNSQQLLAVITWRHEKRVGPHETHETARLLFNDPRSPVLRICDARKVGE